MMSIQATGHTAPAATNDMETGPAHDCGCGCGGNCGNGKKWTIALIAAALAALAGAVWYFLRKKAV